MAVRRVRLRRGTTDENNNYVGVVGEVTVDTEKKTLHIHDGTAGGETLLRSDMSNNASIATDINFTNADRTIGSAMTDDGAGTPTTLTLGGAGSKVLIAGSLEVTGNTTQAQSLLVESRVIQIADGAEADGANTHDVGIFFTRTDGANKGLFFWDEAGDTFKLGLDGNNLAPTATNFDTDDVNYTPASLSLGSLNVNGGDITNVGDIALDTISAASDGDTIGMTLKQAGEGAAFTIVDNDANGANTFLTIDATDGADKLTISTASLDVSSVTSIDNAVTINESGADKDFRVGGTGKANALFVQGSDGFVGINNGAPTVQLDVTGDALITGSVSLDGAVTINNSAANVDFIVKGDTDANLLHVDADVDRVGISTATPSKTLDVAGTFGVSLKSTLAGSLDLTTASSDGITFRSEIAADGVDADATLLRVNIGGAGPTYKTLSWDADTDRFTFDTDAQILNGGLVLGDGTNATTISVPDQTVGNTAGGNLTISAGVGNGTGTGGSLIFQTGADNAGALSTVLTLDKDNKATFTGNIDFSDGTTLGGSVGNTHTMTLGGDTGSTVTTAGNLTVTSALTINGTGATALDFTNDNITIGGSVADGTKTITLGGGAIVATAGNLSVGGNIDFSNGTTLGSSVVNNQSMTLGGNVGSTVITAGDLTVQGSDISLGTATTTSHATISLPNTTVAQAGRNLTISTGVGSAGNGTNDGSLILRTGITTVLTLDTAEKATFAGDIDFSDGTTLGGSVVDGDTLTLGGDVASTTNVAGILQVTSNTIKSSTASAITLSSDDVTVKGDFTVEGASSRKVNLGATDESNPFEIAMQPRASGGAEANNQAGANLTITAGRSTGTGAGGSLIFRTSATGDAENNTANTLNDVLTLDTAQLATFSGNVKVDGNVIQSSGGNNTITLSGSNATILGDLTVSGNDLNFADDDVNIGAAVDTTGKVITIGGATDMITKTAGILTVGGDSIKSSTAEAITLSSDDVTVLGDLSITGASSQTVNLGASDSDSAFEIAVQKRTGGGAEADNKVGADLTISAGASTGKGTGGSIFFKTPRFNSDNIANGTDDNNNVENPLDTVLELDENKLASFAGAVTIAGNLTVNGTTTTIDSTVSTYVDPMILLNKDDLADTDTGVFMGREATDGHNVAMYWDHGESSFAFASVNADASDTTVAVDLSAAAAYALQPVKALSIGMGTTDTTASNTIQTRNANAFVVKGNAQGGADTGNNLVVDTVAGQIETRKIVPLANDTYDIGASGTSFATGYFTSLDTTSNVQFDGDVSLGTDADNQDKEITVVARSGNDKVGNDLTLTAGQSTGTGAGGSLIFKTSATGADVAGDEAVANTIQTVLTLDTNKLATFGGNISGGADSDFRISSEDNLIFQVDSDENSDVADASTFSFRNGDDTTLVEIDESGHLTLIGSLKSAGNLTFHIDSDESVVDGNNKFSFVKDDGTTEVAQITDQGHLQIDGDLTVSGNTIKSSGATAITLSNDDATVVGGLTITGTGIASDGSTNGQLIVGAVGADAHFSANSPASGGANVADQASGDFIISTGKSTGTGAGGSIIFQTSESAVGSANTQNSLQTVLTLDKDLLATFAGNIQLGTDVIQSSNGDNTITLNEDDATVLGGLTITGTGIIPSAGALGGAGQLVIGAGAGADSHLTATHCIGGGANDIASGNFIISAGKSVGNGAGGSIVFQTSESGAGNQTVNDLQTVLTLDKDKLATFAGNIKVTGNTIKSSTNDAITLDGTNVTVKGDLTVEGRDVVLGTAGGGATTISVPQSGADSAGHNLTISAGQGNGAGRDGGTLAFQTGGADGAAVANALSLGADKKATFAGAIDVTTTSILRGNTSLYSSANLFVYSDAGTTAKFTVDGATGDTSIVGTLGVTGITTLDDTLKIKTSPTDSVGILFNSDTADADITLLKVNDGTANVQLDWDDSESSFVVKGGKLHSETDFSVGGTITTNPNFKVDSSGNVTIKGTLSTTSASGHISFRDRIVALATNSASASNDIGFYGLYKNDNINEVEYYSGLVYQPIDTAGNNGKLGVWKLFHSESVGADAVNITVEDTNLGVLDISELRGGSALGSNDTAGADLTITGGKSTGSETGGGIVFKTGGSGAGAAVENTPTTALTIDNAQKATLNVAGAGLDITKSTVAYDEGDGVTAETSSRAISLTYTFDGAMADASTSETITVTTNKASATSVVIGTSSLDATVEVFGVSATGFKFRFTNISGGDFTDTSTGKFNFVIL